MQVSTQSSPSTTIVSKNEQFLIVPIFFKNQIEALVKANIPDSVFGFFYGEQRENYRIIKKIWPVPHSESTDRKVTISPEDFEQAKTLQRGDSLTLLGCFYKAKNGAIRKAILSQVELQSFSFVELSETENESCIWSSSVCAPSHQMYQEKVIL